MFKSWEFLWEFEPSQWEFLRFGSSNTVYDNALTKEVKHKIPPNVRKQCASLLNL